MNTIAKRNFMSFSKTVSLYSKARSSVVFMTFIN
jgi:hypothetical protein